MRVSTGLEEGREEAYAGQLVHVAFDSTWSPLDYVAQRGFGCAYRVAGRSCR